MFENDGERLTLVDDKGNIIEGDDLLTLYAVMVARTRSRARIAVPVTAPASIEELVGLHGGTVIRTKTDVRSLMSLTAVPGDKRSPQADFAGDDSGGFVFGEFM